MSKLRGIIAGLGHIALSGHLPSWKSCQTVEIVGGIDTDVKRQDLLKQQIPDAVCANSLQELLKKIPAEKIDFIDICTPPFAHFELAKTALENAWHVLCEKPLVLKIDELQILQNLAHSKNLTLYTVHNWRFAPICLKISELAKQNVIGEIDRVEWNVLRSGPSITTDPNNWRLDAQKAGGGILIDHGWHALYLVLDWIKQPVQKSQIILENRRYLDLAVEDTATIQLQFAAQKSAQIFLTWASTLRKNSGALYSKTGQILMQDDHLKILKNGKEREIISFDQALSAGSHHPEWFAPIVQEFLAEVQNQAVRHTNLKTASEVLQITKSKDTKKI